MNESRTWDLGVVLGQWRQLKAVRVPSGVWLIARTPSRPFEQFGNYGFAQEEAVHEAIRVPMETVRALTAWLLEIDPTAAASGPEE